jgi:predicted  nucleic acid-binding Zn-ribbon protein
MQEEYFGDITTRVNDLEERQRLLKERVILVGTNLIETKEEFGKEIINLKLAIENMRQDMKKVKEAVLRVSEELDKKARKFEVELLAKQMKMFEPFVGKK